MYDSWMVPVRFLNGFWLVYVAASAFPSNDFSADLCFHFSSLEAPYRWLIFNALVCTSGLFESLEAMVRLIGGGIVCEGHGNHFRKKHILLPA